MTKGISRARSLLTTTPTLDKTKHSVGDTCWEERCHWSKVLPRFHIDQSMDTSQRFYLWPSSFTWKVKRMWRTKCCFSTIMSDRSSTFSRSLSQLSHRSSTSLKRQISLEGLPNFTNARHQRLYCKYWNPKLEEDEDDPRFVLNFYWLDPFCPRYRSRGSKLVLCGRRAIGPAQVSLLTDTLFYIVYFVSFYLIYPIFV